MTPAVILHDNHVNFIQSASALIGSISRYGARRRLEAGTNASTLHMLRAMKAPITHWKDEKFESNKMRRRGFPGYGTLIKKNKMFSPCMSKETSLKTREEYPGIRCNAERVLSGVRIACKDGAFLAENVV